MRMLTALLCVGAVLLAIGCGPPGEVLMENKEATPRAAGSFVRIVNLLDKQVRVKRGNTNVGFWVGSNDYSKPMITRSGKVALDLLVEQADGSEKSTPIEFDFKPELVHTLVVFSDGSHVFTDGEPVKSIMGKELVVRVVAPGKPAAELSKPVTVKIGSDEVQVTKAENALSQTGSFEAVGLKGDPSGSTDSKWASTLLIVDHKGLFAFALRNGEDQQPVSNSNAQGG